MPLKTASKQSLDEPLRSARARRAGRRNSNTKFNDSNIFVDLRNIKTSCSLTDCLADLTAPVQLTGDSRYRCSHCRSLQNAEKRELIVKLPRVLVFFINRTHWSTHGKCKLDSLVDFPAERLDMTPYCSVPEVQEQHAPTSLGRAGAKRPRNARGDTLVKVNEERERYLYNLSAVVLHHGRNMDQGHYTAQCWSKRSPLNVCVHLQVTSGETHFSFLCLLYRSPVADLVALQ